MAPRLIPTSPLGQVSRERVIVWVAHRALANLVCSPVGEPVAKRHPAAGIRPDLQQDGTVRGGVVACILEATILRKETVHVSSLELARVPPIKYELPRVAQGNDSVK